jgi:hypothetical protein
VKSKESALSITATSPSAASNTTVHTTAFKGGFLQKADFLVIDASLAGGTGGSLDVYLQRQLASNSWVDWVHFPQLTAASTKKYTLVVDGKGGTSIVEVGGGTDAAPGVALAANSFVNTMPLGDVRIVFVTGVGNSAGASQTITITPVTSQH